MSHRTVVFDLDGTLVDTIPLILASYRHAFREVLDEDVDEPWVRSLIGQPLIRSMQLRSPEHAQALYDAYLRHNIAHTETLIREYAGIDEMLETLSRAGLQLGVATSKRRAQAQTAMDLVGLSGRVPLLATMEDTTAHKPDPEPLLHALQALGSEPASSAYVGDAHVDILAARAAGMTPVGVTWGAGTREALLDAGAAALADTPAQLTQILLSSSS